MTGAESPAANLGRIVEDGLRIAAGRRALDALLRRHAHEGVALLLVDLDNSATVRVQGIEAKVAVVRQALVTIRAVAPDGALVVDSGTRDETYVALPGAGRAAALATAAQLRAAIRATGFRLPGGEVVRLTASVGVAFAPEHGGCAADLAWSAGQALARAKQRRDAAAEPPAEATVEREVRVPAEHAAALEALAEAEGRTVTSLQREALALLHEKHGGIWHWAVDRRTAV